MCGSRQLLVAGQHETAPHNHPYDVVGFSSQSHADAHFPSALSHDEGHDPVQPHGGE